MQNRNIEKIKSVSLVFPNQLFKKNPCIEKHRIVYLVEEYLYFKQYKFHKQKIAFHRSSMKFYENYLLNKGLKVVYIDSLSELSDIRNLMYYLSIYGIDEIFICDVVDNWLEKRIKKQCKLLNVQIRKFESPLFINSKEDINVYFSERKRLHQTDFYIYQRKKRKILLDEINKPVGGKWSYDAENRLKYPSNRNAPQLVNLTANSFDIEANEYTLMHFSHHYGNISIKYPNTYSEAGVWFNEFLNTRFEEFGRYEDAIVAEELLLNHSLLSPLLNTGLLLPEDVIEQAIVYAEAGKIQLNSLEGFIRQILGWREFIRMVYELKGKEERTKNFWGFSRKIPDSFWNGTTGIEPLDITIQKVLKTGYCHHIERLMVLGNFMLLCEFNPDEVYSWFMELFIDAYDWVMVPNVYGMSQFADGGMMATKPYISGSNYLMKMSNYRKGDWQAIWDGLFWRFMNVHKNFFMQNSRRGMLLKTFDKMDKLKREAHLNNAEQFLNFL